MASRVGAGRGRPHASWASWQTYPSDRPDLVWSGSHDGGVVSFGGLREVWRRVEMAVIEPKVRGAGCAGLAVEGSFVLNDQNLTLSTQLAPPAHVPTNVEETKR
jgi:hypothetical protein